VHATSANNAWSVAEDFHFMNESSSDDDSLTFNEPIEADKA
jgi:hypothetical protein